MNNKTKKNQLLDCQKIFQKDTTARTRTVNLLLRRQAPYPLGHSGLWRLVQIKLHDILKRGDFKLNI